jgi:hypothetical protein
VATNSLLRSRGASILAIITTLLALAVVSCAQQGGDPAGSASQPASGSSAAAVAVEPTKAQLEEWQRAMAKVQRPKEGCFNATFPDRQWREVPCKTPPNKLYPPRNRGGMTSTTVVGGAGPDFAAAVTGHITEARGSFDAVSITGSQCSVACPGGTCPASPSCTGLPANTYTLQLNSAPFTTSACSGSPTPATCQGWQQFVFDGAGGGGFIQYWLLRYGPAGTMCPTPRHAGSCGGFAWSDGWCPFQFSPTGPVYCVVNAATAAPAPATPVSSLGSTSLTGSAAGGGATSDSIHIGIGSTLHAASGNNYFPDLGTQWQAAEFNVFGDGNGSQAVFGNPTTLTVRTAVSSGTSSGPNCSLQSYTGESSNLTLVNMAPAAAPGSMPALVFTESNAPPSGSAATCADATSVGDTHLLTFRGLYYDFQASGDFVLADRGPSFVVQNRQVSGAPTWPNASVNSAVGARMGKTTVAVCLPGRIEVNGKATTINDGTSRTLADGVAISRVGNVYLVANADGDSLRAQVNSGWIDASVGLGRWPTKVKGLLAHPGDDVNELAMSDGTVLKAPVAFDVLYKRYGESWRVKADQAFLCKGSKVAKGVPAKPFYAKDLDRQRADKARAVCLKAGVREGPLLESCTLDVVVIGNEQAAKAFVGARAPAVVARH